MKWISFLVVLSIELITRSYWSPDSYISFKWLLILIVKKIKKSLDMKKEKREKKVGKRFYTHVLLYLSLAHILPSFFPLNMSSFGLTFWSSYLFDTRQIFRRASSVVRDGISLFRSEYFSARFWWFFFHVFWGKSNLLICMVSMNRWPMLLTSILW